MVFASAAAGESSRRIEHQQEESGQTADREDAERRPETQSANSDSDERNERMQAMANRFRSFLESMNDGTVDCGDSRLPSDGYVMYIYISMSSVACWTIAGLMSMQL